VAGKYTPLDIQDPVQKSSRVRWLAGALIVLIIIAPLSLYAWRYLYNPCEVEAVKEASTFLTTQLNFYDRVYQVASTASRTAPYHPVEELKQIRMDTEELTVPACMQTAKKELIHYMGTVILAFQAYRAGEADTAVLELIRQSDVQYGNFKTELKAINECAPLCIR
jgi:hypothetical protein